MNEIFHSNLLAQVKIKNKLNFSKLSKIQRWPPLGFVFIRNLYLNVVYCLNNDLCVI